MTSLWPFVKLQTRRFEMTSFSKDFLRAATVCDVLPLWPFILLLIGTIVSLLLLEHCCCLPAFAVVVEGLTLQILQLQTAEDRVELTGLRATWVFVLRVKLTIAIDGVSWRSCGDNRPSNDHFKKRAFELCSDRHENFGVMQRHQKTFNQEAQILWWLLKKTVKADLIQFSGCQRITEVDLMRNCAEYYIT